MDQRQIVTITDVSPHSDCHHLHEIIDANVLGITPRRNLNNIVHKTVTPQRQQLLWTAQPLQMETFAMAKLL